MHARLELVEQLARAGGQPRAGPGDDREGVERGRLWPLCDFLESHSYSAAVKTACALVGDTTGPVRAPLLALDDDATFELGGLLDRAGATMATVQISQ